MKSGISGGQIIIMIFNMYNEKVHGKLNISDFDAEINSCKIKNRVDSSYIYGDRRELNYKILMFYDLNKIRYLKQYYANCQHPYINWTFQFISSIYGDKIEYLQRVFTRFSNMDFSTECKDAYYMFGYAYSLLAIIDISDKSKGTDYGIWQKLLELAYLFLTQFILVSPEKSRNIQVSDALSNRARLLHAYYDDFMGIFFNVSGPIDVDFNYVSDKYMAFVVGEDNPLRVDFHKDALMMYQNGSVKRVTGLSLTEGGDGTFHDVINTGIARSKQLYSFLLDSFINGRLYLSDSEIEWAFNNLKEKWLALKPIFPSFLDKELGNHNKFLYEKIRRNY